MIGRRALLGGLLASATAAGAQSFRVGRAPGFRSGLRFLSQAAAVAYTTWNPADKLSTVTLSNGNLTATAPSGGGYGDSTNRSVAGKTSGKWYFECSFNGPGLPGIAVSTTANSTYPGSDAGSVGYVSANGNVYNNAAVVATYSTFGAGDIIGVAFDMSAKKVWFAKNGAWNGSPSAGTGGIAFTGSQIYAVADPSGGASPTSITANFGATAFTYPAPAGFGPFTTGST